MIVVCSVQTPIVCVLKLFQFWSRESTLESPPWGSKDLENIGFAHKQQHTSPLISLIPIQPMLS